MENGVCDMNSNSDESNFGAFLIGFFLGGVIGAFTGLILAPQSGDETRSQIIDKSIELKDKASQTGNELARLTQERAAGLQKRSSVLIEEETDFVGDNVNEEPAQGIPIDEVSPSDGE